MIHSRFSFSFMHILFLCSDRLAHSTVLMEIYCQVLENYCRVLFLRIPGHTH